jgi:hypothetical protein
LVEEIKMACLDGIDIKLMMIGIIFLMEVPLGSVLPLGVGCGSILP